VGPQHGSDSPDMHLGWWHLSAGVDRIGNDERSGGLHDECHLALPTVHGGSLWRGLRRHCRAVRWDLRYCKHTISSRRLGVIHLGSLCNFITPVAGASYYLAATCSAIIWGILADKLGRRPTLLAGTLGTCMANLVFGFAPSYKVAVFGR